MNKKTLWITRTAVFTALLIVAQMATAPLGNTLVTGSLVNMILAVSVMTSGLASGLTVAAISPVCAKLIGIGPLWPLIPFIMAGNISLVLVWNYAGNRSFLNKYASYAFAVVTAAVVKFIVLYFGIVKFAIPIMLALPEKQAAAVSAIFSVPQLFTALIGGALAAAIIPVVKKAAKH